MLLNIDNTINDKYCLWFDIVCYQLGILPVSWIFRGNTHGERVQWGLHIGRRKRFLPFFECLEHLQVDIGESRNILSDNEQEATRLLAYISAFRKDLTKNSRPAAIVDDPKPLSK